MLKSSTLIRIALGACVASGLVGLSGEGVSEAQAQPAEDPAVVKAREQFLEGLALMTAEDWAGALAKFKAVGQVRMTAPVAFNIAECEEKLGRLVSALGNYRLALAKAQEAPGAKGTEKVVQNAPQRIEAIEPRIAKLKVVRKEDKPNPRAKIELDGAELDPTQIGTDMRVDPGERTLRVLVDGKPVKTEKVKLGDGETKEISIEVPAPKEGPSTPDPTTPPPVEEGGPSIPGIVLTAFGGASLVAGFVAIGLRQQAIGELDDLCGGDSSCPPSAESTYDRGRLMTGLAEVFLPVGAAATTVGIVLIATMSGGSKTEADETAPVVSFTSPDGTGPGLGVAGRF